MNFIHKFLSGEVPSDATVLDIGCGIKEYSRYGICTTVDAWDKVKPDYLLDLEVERLPFEENSFDYVFLIDVIEHLDKDKGLILLDDCKKICKNKIFIFTPLEFDTNEKHTHDANCWAYGNIYNYHKSLWSLKDFTDWHQLIKDSNTFPSYWGYWKKIK